jgi:hypothetical protein
MMSLAKAQEGRTAAIRDMSPVPWTLVAARKRDEVHGTFRDRPSILFMARPWRRRLVELLPFEERDSRPKLSVR